MFDFENLRPNQLDYLVSLEVIGEEADYLGERIRFALETIQKESSQFHDFINKCIGKYQKELQALKYDLSDKKVMSIIFIYSLI